MMHEPERSRSEDSPGNYRHVDRPDSDGHSSTGPGSRGPGSNASDSGASDSGGPDGGDADVREPDSAGRQRRFASTQWSMVHAAGDEDPRIARDALQRLCEIYWYPLYAYLRRQGKSADESADLTQGFFADLLARGDIKRVKKEQGRFRSFLLASLKHFVINQWDRRQAKKRGGDQHFLSIDYRAADSRYQLEPADEQTPDRMYERQWALTLLDRTRSALHDAMHGRGRGAQFDALHVFLAGKTDEASFSDVANRLQMSEVAAKVALHRMRQQFGKLLRDEIRQTVEDPAEVDGEVRALFEALKG